MILPILIFILVLCIFFIVNRHSINMSLLKDKIGISMRVALLIGIVFIITVVLFAIIKWAFSTVF